MAKGMWSAVVSGKSPTPASPRPAIPRRIENILSWNSLKQKYALRIIRIPQIKTEVPKIVAVGPTPRSLM